MGIMSMNRFVVLFKFLLLFLISHLIRVDHVQQMYLEVIGILGLPPHTVNVGIPIILVR